MSNAASYQGLFHDNHTVYQTLSLAAVVKNCIGIITKQYAGQTVEKKTNNWIVYEGLDSQPSFIDPNNVSLFLGNLSVC